MTEMVKKAGAVASRESARRLVDEHEAAALLGLSVKTLRRWRWAGRELPFVKLGGSVRYDLADIDAYVAAGRHDVREAA